MLIACCAKAAARMASIDYKEGVMHLHAFEELALFSQPRETSLEIRGSVSRLELPVVADYLV